MRLGWIVVCLLATAGCAQAPAAASSRVPPSASARPASRARAAPIQSPSFLETLEEVALEGLTMGSTWHVKVSVPSSLREDARALQMPIEAILERINDEMSTYRPTSEISRFNAHRSTDPFPVSAELALVVARALEIGAATDGAYDITIDPLINLWGFDRSGSRRTPPTAEEIGAARGHTGLALVRVEQTALRKADPHVTINLGGIASGFAVDLVLALLEERGFVNAMVEVTGEVRVRGTNAKGAPWKIGVKAPDMDDPGVVTSVALVDRALTTSGTYHNFFDSGGKRFSHILDPRTGAPIQTSLVSVTVLARDALTADGYDTAFMILGEERARQIIASNPGMEALFLYDDGQRGHMSATAGFPALARVAVDGG